MGLIMSCMSAAGVCEGVKLPGLKSSRWYLKASRTDTSSWGCRALAVLPLVQASCFVTSCFNTRLAQMVTWQQKVDQRIAQRKHAFPLVVPVGLSGQCWQHTRMKTVTRSIRSSSIFVFSNVPSRSMQSRDVLPKVFYDVP